MAKRGRPRKTTKIEEVEDVIESIIDETPNKVAKEKEVQDFVGAGIENKDQEIDISDVDYQTNEPNIYDLNTPKSISGPYYNPFAEDVVEKEYRTPQIATAESIPDIIEPAFQKPTYDDLIASNEENAPEEQQDKIGVDAFSQNLDQSETTKSEQESNADGLVDVCLVAYGVLNNLGGKMARISDAKLSKYESEGMLDRRMEIPVDANTNATVEEIVESLNTQVDDIFVVSDEFEERTRPLMKKIFLKKGWGVSDEQQLLMYVAADVQEKVMASIQIRKAANYQLDSFSQMYERKLEIDNRQAKADFVASGVEEKVAEQVERTIPNDEIFGGNVPADNVDVSNLMVENQSPDIKVRQSDLDQIDVDKV